MNAFGIFILVIIAIGVLRGFAEDMSGSSSSLDTSYNNTRKSLAGIRNGEVIYHGDGTSSYIGSDGTVYHNGMAKGVIMESSKNNEILYDCDIFYY